jgi:hypothetical protein
MSSGLAGFEIEIYAQMAAVFGKNGESNRCK